MTLIVAHSFHEDLYEYGLHPGCPRCEQHAERPWESLDKEILSRIARGDLHTPLDRQAHQRLIEHFGDDLANVEALGESV